jgi:hypothetical protein
MEIVGGRRFLHTESRNAHARGCHPALRRPVSGSGSSAAVLSRRSGAASRRLSTNPACRPPTLGSPHTGGSRRSGGPCPPCAGRPDGGRWRTESPGNTGRGHASTGSCRPHPLSTKQVGPPLHIRGRRVGEGGFEPPASCSQSRCATAALLPGRLPSGGRCLREAAFPSKCRGPALTRFLASRGPRSSPDSFS